MAKEYYSTYKKFLEQELEDLKDLHTAKSFEKYINKRIKQTRKDIEVIAQRIGNNYTARFFEGQEKVEGFSANENHLKEFGEPLDLEQEELLEFQKSKLFLENQFLKKELENGNIEQSDQHLSFVEKLLILDFLILLGKLPAPKGKANISNFNSFYALLLGETVENAKKAIPAFHKLKEKPLTDKQKKDWLNKLKPIRGLFKDIEEVQLDNLLQNFMDKKGI